MNEPMNNIDLNNEIWSKLINKLPLELWPNIFKYLKPIDIYNLVYNAPILIKIIEYRQKFIGMYNLTKNDLIKLSMWNWTDEFINFLLGRKKINDKYLFLEKLCEYDKPEIIYKFYLDKNMNKLTFKNNILLRTACKFENVNVVKMLLTNNKNWNRLYNCFFNLIFENCKCDDLLKILIKLGEINVDDDKFIKKYKNNIINIVFKQKHIERIHDIFKKCDIYIKKEVIYDCIINLTKKIERAKEDYYYLGKGSNIGHHENYKSLKYLEEYYKDNYLDNYLIHETSLLSYFY